MEDQQATAEPSQQFENIDFNSSPEDNKESSNNEEQEQVTVFVLLYTHNFSKNPYNMSANFG